MPITQKTDVRERGRRELTIHFTQALVLCCAA
jgi:hypothetical protein